MKVRSKDIKVLAFILSVIVWLLFVFPAIRTHAGMLYGDEPIGGFSYLMDCAYKNKVPTGLYADWYYRAYHRFHYEIPLDEESRAILERIVEAEATSGNKEQKMNVASCVLARVSSKAWPNTVEEVVFQKTQGVWQFSPLGDGRYFTVKITQVTQEAVESVLKNGLTHSCLWFCSKGSYEKKDKNGKYTSWHRKTFGDYEFYDGEHCYFK